MTDTPDDTPGSADGTSSDPGSAESGRGRARPAPPAYSLRTKLIVGGALALGIGMFVLAGTRGNTGSGSDFVVSGGNTGEVAGTEGVEAIVPPRNATQVLAQDTIGIDLAPGWTGELVLELENGTTVPVPDDELTVVPELDQLFFEPAEDKIIERLPQGTNCVVATIWDRRVGRTDSERVERWCFNVF